MLQDWNNPSDVNGKYEEKILRSIAKCPVSGACNTSFLPGTFATFIGQSCINSPKVARALWLAQSQPIVSLLSTFFNAWLHPRVDLCTTIEVTPTTWWVCDHPAKWSAEFWLATLKPFEKGRFHCLFVLGREFRPKLILISCKLQRIYTANRMVTNALQMHTC